MQNQMIELMKQYNESLLASAQRLGELNVKTFEKLSAKQAEVVNQCVESATAHVEALSKVSDPKELVETQTAFGQGCGEKLVSNLRDYSELLNEAREELATISEEAVANVSENVEKAGELLKEAA